ncbi:MAG: hypothetical protein K0S18_283 [Anaerocolumna sp.]|jgi:hypothetical protein|nr:hypothetical protein [Anaerocolumna sp.]
MNYSDKEHGIKLYVEDGKYLIFTMEPWRHTPYVENEIKEPIYIGSFLMKISNISYDLLAIYNNEFTFALQDLYHCNAPEMEYKDSDSLEIKKVKQLYKKMDDDIPTNINDEIDDLLENYKSNIRSNLFLSKFHISEFEQELFAELLVYEIYTKLALPTFNPTDITTFLPDFLINPKSLRSSCINILNYKLDKPFPNAIQLIENSCPQVSFNILEDNIFSTYHIHTLSELFALDSFLYINSDLTICLCYNCGKYFFKQKRSTETLCNYIYRNNMTCNELGKAKSLKKDAFTKAVSIARKNENDYFNHHIQEVPSSDYYNGNSSYDRWSNDLSQIATNCRINEDIDALNTWISDTSFRKIGLTYPQKEMNS